MKFKIWIAALILFFSNSVNAIDVLSSGNIPSGLNYFLNCFAEEQFVSHKLKLVTQNIEGECGIETLGLVFDYDHPLNVPLARRLIVRLIQDLLKGINSQEKFRPFFHCFPIDIDNLDIRIRWRSTTCGYFYPALGNVVYVSAIDGLITYGTLNSITNMMESLHWETYTQALKILPAIPPPAPLPPAVIPPPIPLHEIPSAQSLLERLQSLPTPQTGVLPQSTVPQAQVLPQPAFPQPVGLPQSAFPQPATVQPLRSYQ